jgi:hypothetical protein
MRPRPALRLACLLIVVALMGCAKLAETPPHQGLTDAPTPPEQARLLVYRPAATHLLGAVGDREIALNDAPACGLSDQHYFVRLVPAGATTIGDGASRLSFAAEAGRTYVVRIGFNKRRASFAGWVPPVLGFNPDTVTADSGLYSIELVEPQAAANELQHVSPESACL